TQGRAVPAPLARKQRRQRLEGPLRGRRRGSRGRNLSYSRRAVVPPPTPPSSRRGTPPVAVVCEGLFAKRTPAAVRASLMRLFGWAIAIAVRAAIPRAQLLACTCPRGRALPRGWGTLGAGPAARRE